MFTLSVIVAALFAGSLIYCCLIILAARSYAGQACGLSPDAGQRLAPLSVLKPLSGADEGLELNLRSLFEQDHPSFEILFAVRTTGDPAIQIVEKLQREFPARSARVIVTGEPTYANAKVYSLQRMLPEATHDLLVMSDSDVRIAPGFLKRISGEFQDPNVALATCPYRAIAGASLWSTLEAEGMNTEFLSGLLVARMLEGVKFAVGPTVVARKSALQAIGGFNKLKDYLAEDYVMGKFAAAAGFGVILSRNVVEHRIGSENWQANAAHRIRWVRSTRRSRPLGYLGQIFTYPLPLALLLCAVDAGLWPAILVALAFRAADAWSTSVWILRARPHWLLLPFEEILSFLFWLSGFFGNTIVWRGRRYYLYSDGRFELR